MQVDVSCFACEGTGELADGSRDPLCKGSGWIEILGAGMVDPNVFGFVRDHGYDPETTQGFAFGMGIERIAMLKHGVPDLRKFFENDVRMLEQFSSRGSRVFAGSPSTWIPASRPRSSPTCSRCGRSTSSGSRASACPRPTASSSGGSSRLEKHPNADRLSVTEVDTGDGTRTIVCGAPNVAAGQTVPVALPGAVLPGGQELGKAKLRGVESDGMILSETELQLGDDADGIMVLGETGEPGTPLADVLPIAEAVLELDLNPNRVDLFGIYGVAREVHAITGAELAPPPWSDDAEPAGDTSAEEVASVTVEVPDLCPRFTARVFTGVRIGPSPLWLRQRLIAAGQRPISNVVDITNYVMLLTAQPLHAYDLDLVPGGELIVRTAARRRDDDDAGRRRAQRSTARRSSSATASSPPGSRGSWVGRCRRSPAPPPASCSRRPTGTA